MKYVIIYWTRFGNNKRIVEHLATKLDGEVSVFKTDEADPAKMPDADFYIFSSAAEKFSVQKDMRKFMKGLENMGQKKYGIINTHAMKNKNWLGKMEKILSKKGMVKVAEVDFAMGDNTDKGQGQPEGWEQKLDAFASRLK